MKACRGGGTVSSRLSHLKAKMRQALSTAAEPFTSESLNRDRALLTPSACTVYSSSAGKHQAVLAERQTEARMFVCVKAFFLLLAHSERMSLSELFRNWYSLPGVTSRFVLEWRTIKSLHAKLTYHRSCKSSMIEDDLKSIFSSEEPEYIHRLCKWSMTCLICDLEWK